MQHYVSGDLWMCSAYVLQNRLMYRAECNRTDTLLHVRGGSSRRVVQMLLGLG